MKLTCPKGDFILEPIFCHLGGQKKDTIGNNPKNTSTSGIWMHDASFFPRRHCQLYLPGFLPIVDNLFVFLFHFPAFSTKKRCHLLAPPDVTSTSRFLPTSLGCPNKNQQVLELGLFVQENFFHLRRKTAGGWMGPGTLARCVWNFLEGFGGPFLMTCWSCVLWLII